MKRRNKIYTGAAIAALLMGSAVAVPQTLIPNATITASAATTIRETIGGVTYDFNSSTHTATIAGIDASIESFTTPEKVTYDNIEYDVTAIRDYALISNSNLKTLTITSNIKSLGISCFSNCDKLETVTIIGTPKIKRCAFEGCKALKNVTLDANMAELGEKMFSCCESLKTITLPPELTLINCGAFSECTSLSSISIPESVETIDSFAFSGCTALKAIKLPNKLQKLENYAFQNCSLLKNISIPEKVEAISTGVFKECTALNNVTLNNGLKTIGESVFEGCSALTSITIPKSVETISKGAFIDCANLSNIDLTISNNLNLYYNSFDNCPKLLSINNKEVNCSYNKEKKDMVFDRNELYPFIHKYFNASEKVGFVDKYVKKYCEGIVEQEVKPGMTKLQIAKALHDWVIGKVDYDSADTDAPRNHCDVSIFLNNKTVCDGYARGYSILMKEAGFDESYYSNGDHAWNKIKIDNLCFNVDTTWDDSAKPDYEWFMLSGKEFVEKEAVSHKGANDDYPYSGIPMGDLNMDKVIDEADIEFLKNNSDTLNDNQKILADLNFNGKIDDEDLTLLGKKYGKRFDLNNDGKINNNDLALLQYIRKVQIEFVKNVIYKADNNNDGLIDSKDVKEMRYYLKKYCNQESNEYYRMGDLNLDGTVDKNDLIALQKYGNKHISFKASSKLADLNCDGIVDELDYNLLKEMTKYQLGDVDLNGTVDSADRDLIMNHILKKTNLSRKSLWYADLNDDCTIDEKDIALLCVDYNIPDYQLGDVDFNGTVDMADKELIMNHIANIELLPNVALSYADVNRDGSVNVLDVVQLCRDYNITD
ncbi:leucine-rich repeat protein [uncultured Ruminococcus sp.]|uniref:leucine-rich repeat protein n=1 Tax=uncultured Ruminococcus sp. TaxID=165186 RepID=UPI002619E5AA|nr:leucine-rich repeat protein [uncultured Ruminococcus sp.]